MNFKKSFPPKNSLWLIYTFLWLAFCTMFLLPHIRYALIGFAQDHLFFVNSHTFEEWNTRLFQCGLLGYAFYLFTLFLLVLEIRCINAGGDEHFDWTPLFFAVITVLSIAIRCTGFNLKTGDYAVQSGWVSHLRENGHFFGFKTFPGNYNAIYMYFLALLSYIPVKYELWLMKIISCVFDYICALYSMKLVRQMTGSAKIGLLTYGVVLFSPTVFLNSGTWAQCDGMHTAFILMSVFYVLNGKIRSAMACFGVGLSFKLQGIFSFPFFIIIFIYKKISMKNLLFILTGFFSVSVPAWLFGWNPVKCITNYLAGTNLGGPLALGAPSIFSWGNIPGMMPVVFLTAMLFCIGFLIINKISVPSDNTILLLFLFCNFAIPFFLPNMHERYFYIGEIAVLLYSIVNPKRFWISFFVILPALATYFGYLFGSRPFTLQQLSLPVLGGAVIITTWLISSILHDQNPGASTRPLHGGRD
jgi:hypothetical protein